MLTPLTGLSEMALSPRLSYLLPSISRSWMVVAPEKPGGGVEVHRLTLVNADRANHLVATDVPGEVGDLHALVREGLAGTAGSHFPNPIMDSVLPV
jgi:hypothetical protein